MVEELKKLTTRVAHVLPVSDDGGSTAEIVRVLGNSASRVIAIVSVCSVSPRVAADQSVLGCGFRGVFLGERDELGK